MSSEIIAENRRLYASDIVSFEHASLLNTSLPRADLIIARDILFHLNSAHIVSALANFRRSDSSWLLTTTFPWVTSNKDLEPKSEPYLGFQAQPHKPVWGYREINLDIAPFDLGANGHGDQRLAPAARAEARRCLCEEEDAEGTPMSRALRMPGPSAGSGRGSPRMQAAAGPSPHGTRAQQQCSVPVCEACTSLCCRCGFHGCNCCCS